MPTLETGSMAGPEDPASTPEDPAGAPEDAPAAPDSPGSNVGGRVVVGNPRSADGRLARLHLRTGALGLARAELESLAGAGRLDDPALLDLAEVRWRTGDLPGAGEAAAAYLESTAEDGSRDPRDELVALVVAAEATAEAGRSAEARKLAARALDRAQGSLDGLFAGMPRGTIWPHDVARHRQPSPSPDRTIPETHHARQPGEPMRARSETAPTVPTLWSPEPAPSEQSRSRFDPAAELEAARAALAAGESDAAATRLAIVLRLAAATAPAVLDVLDQAPADEPMLAIVRGDALRLAGRETDAERSYATAVRGLAARDGEPGADLTPQPPDTQETQ